jgi:dipeptidyl aminopeptidase/acylaminoacyl peptidase
MVEWHPELVYHFSPAEILPMVLSPAAGHSRRRQPVWLAALLLAVATHASAQRPAPDYSAPAGAPYVAYNVTVRTPEGHTLAGTLTLPRGASADRRAPAVVTITGSGPQDRDETIGIQGYHPFRQLADSLGRRGVAVLRMDDRGTGASTGTFKGATSLQFADDIRAGLAYLRTRPEIDARKLGLIGHSEGAVIAPIVATKEPSLKGIVLLAGVARPVRAALQYQMTNLANHDTALSSAKRDLVIAAIPARIDSMMAADPWMRFLLPYDPLPTARAVKAPVLILTGANDQQATADQVGLQAAAFRAGGNGDVTAAVVPGLNHLFVSDPDGYPGNYKKLTPPVLMDSGVVGTVVDWLADHLK